MVKKYISAIGGGFLFLIVLFFVLDQLAAIGGNVWLSKWSDHWQEAKNQTSVRDFYLGIYAGFGLLQGMRCHMITGAVLVLLLPTLPAAGLSIVGMLQG